MNNEVVIVLDFGCQHSQLISRKIREENVYCEVLPYYTTIDKIKELSPKGIILTGGPESVYEEDALSCDKEIFSLGIPVLGIGYGTQLMTHLLGGEIAKAPLREYDKVKVNLSPCVLFDDIGSEITAWMGHRDYISKPAPGFDIIATSPNQAGNTVAAVANEKDHLYGLQFNPEVSYTENGLKILHHFLYKICHCTGDWTMDVFTKEMIASLKEKIGDKKVLCALSGGVDSSVAAIMISKAIGKQLTCIFVDHGLLRKNEGDEVEEIFTSKYDLNFIRVNVQDRFYGKLAGVSDPETKRKIIGEEFIRVFEEEAKKIGTVDYLVQGTIYPDVIESGFGKSAVIKSHHNVGGLPDYVDFKEIIEPLRSLFKDEVRKVGLELGIPENLVFRQPFPGPGLAIRIIGDITPEKIAIVQDADHIYREEIAKAGLDRSIGQYFATLTNIRSVGVTDGARTYDYTVALRAVTTTDFMTAEFSELPWDLLGRVSSRIVKEVKHVNRVVYDITGKPPATIEFE